MIFKNRIINNKIWFYKISKNQGSKKSNAIRIRIRIRNTISIIRKILP